LPVKLSHAADVDPYRHNESMKVLGPLAAVLALGLWATAAHGDGGTMLLHRDAGPFTITLFAAPQPLATGAGDLSVMVQDRGSGEVLLDPTIDVTAGLAATDALQQTVRLETRRSGDRLLQTANVQFSKPGKWRLTVLVHRGNDVAQVSTECTIEPNSSRAMLVWFYVLLPVGVILIFVLHQALKQNQGKRPRTADPL
jgi:hypothetical protein